MTHEPGSGPTTQLDAAALTPWTAELADPAHEAAYRASTLTFERLTMRVSAALVLVIDLLSLAIGKLVAGHFTAPAELFVQGASLLLIVSVLAFLGRVPAAHWRLWSLASGLSLILAIALMIAVGQDMSYRGALLIPSGVIVIYLVVRLDLGTLTGLACAYSLSTFSAWLTTLTQPKPADVIFLATLTLVAHALGFSESRRLQRERRMVFVQHQVLTHYATRDDLTGLGSRRHFYALTDARLQRGADAGHELAVMLVDLDRFKEINDTLGHHTGDVLLQQVATRLRRALPQALALARLGGDEFAVLLQDESGTAWGTRQAQAFLCSLDEPFALDGLALHIHASIGLAVCHQGEDRQTLLRHADIAMYRAKARNGGIEVYSSQDVSHTREQVELASELAAALESDAIELHYQPKTAIGSGETLGVEALVRWQHPVHGLLAPARFLPVAERHGLMRKLTLRVIALALQQAQAWQQAGRPLRIAVNLAPESLLDARFPDDVMALLARSTVPASMLQLEITENTIMVDPDRMLRVIARLGQAGFRFALDDYGTGYSSLAYLSLLPLDELKIDRSFVANVTGDASSAVIVRSTIQMARELGFHVVAEGVEDLETWQQLSRFGCDTAQGYYLSRPLPAAQIERWLDQHTSPTARHSAEGSAAPASDTATDSTWNPATVSAAAPAIVPAIVPAMAPETVPAPDPAPARP